MPTVLFSQASGIYNYSKIRFISWKLGVTLGPIMLAGFVAPQIAKRISPLWVKRVAVMGLLALSLNLLGFF